MTSIRNKLQKAFEQQQVVEISYMDRTETASKRMIRPLEWSYRRDTLMLRAYCYLRNDIRDFRLPGIMTCRGVGHSRHPGKPPELKEKVVHFPTRGSLGLLSLYADDYPGGPFGQEAYLNRLGQAKNKKVIPEDKKSSLWAGSRPRREDRGFVDRPKDIFLKLESLEPDALQAINFRGCRLRDEDFEAMRGLRGLELLLLDNHPISNRNLEILGELVNLKVLFLLGDYTPPKLIRDRSLRQVGGPTQHCLDDDGLFSLGNLHNLEALSIKFAFISDDSLMNLSTLKKLKRLYLQMTPLYGTGVEHLCGVCDLQELSLASSRAGDAAALSISRFGNLRYLCLSETEISDEGLQHLQHLNELIQLDLDNTRISNKGLKYVCGLPRLEFLNVAKTRVTMKALQECGLAEKLW